MSKELSSKEKQYILARKVLKLSKEKAMEKSGLSEEDRMKLARDKNSEQYCEYVINYYKNFKVNDIMWNFLLERLMKKILEGTMEDKDELKAIECLGKWTGRLGTGGSIREVSKEMQEANFIIKDKSFLKQIEAEVDKEIKGEDE